MKRAAFLISTISLLSLGLAAPVLAATPSNDAYASRQVIASLPLNASVDTSEATTAAPDAEAIAACAPVPTDASVWYEYTPTTDGSVLIDTSGSGYAADIVVVSGSPGSFVFENCGTPLVLSVTAGVSYKIMVFDFDGSGNGGALELTVDNAPPPPTVAVTVDPSGSFNSRTGSATVHGTVTCSGGNEFGKNSIYIQITQVVGRLRIIGEGATDFICDGTTRTWSFALFAFNGKFAGGKASVSAYVSACGDFSCGSAEADRIVKLKK